MADGMNQSSVDALLNMDDDDEEEQAYLLNQEEEEKLLFDDSDDVIDLGLGMEDEMEDEANAGSKSFKVETNEQDAEEKLGRSSKFSSERSSSPEKFEEPRFNNNYKNEARGSRTNSFSSFRNSDWGMGRYRNKNWGFPHNRRFEKKTVLINPHFKGNARFNNNERWNPRPNSYPNSMQNQNYQHDSPHMNMKPWHTAGDVNAPYGPSPPQFRNQHDIHIHQTQMIFNRENNIPPAYPDTYVPNHMVQNRNTLVPQPQPQLPPATIVNQQQPNFGGPVLCNPNPPYVQMQYNSSNLPHSAIPPHQYVVPNNQSMYQLPPQQQQQQQESYFAPVHNNRCNYSGNYDGGMYGNSGEGVARGYEPERNNNHLRGRGGYNQKWRYKGGVEQRKRRVETSNLQVVSTVETPMEPQEEISHPEEVEEQDEETREYLKKIEKQKQMRLQILKQKEERRKLKLLTEASTNTSNLNQSKETSVPQTNFLPRPRNIVRPIAGNCTRITTAADRSQNPTRVVSVKRNENDNSVPSTFLSSRTVLMKDRQLVETPVVRVRNLAAGTNEGQLRKLCTGIGAVQALLMSPEERQATIEFGSVASAHAFYKKYQRFMLNLSVIEVLLQSKP